MDYSVGCLADLISGSNTPNKPKIIKKKFNLNDKKSNEKQEINVEKKLKRKKDSPRDTAKETSNKIESNIKKPKHVDDQSLSKKGPFKKGYVPRKISHVENETSENKEHQEMYSNRTLFIGNLPVNLHKMKLKRLFEKFGTVESVRFRSIPLADPQVPKKVAMIRKQFHPKRTSFNSYIRFATEEDAVKALELNGHKYRDNHLKVKMCNEKGEASDKRKSIFLGNVSFDAEEEDLWKLFETCGPIESVRLVRDRATNMGKGFGFVNFHSTDAVEIALQMENVMLKNRQLRISACQLTTSKNKKKVKKEKSPKTKQSNEVNMEEIEPPNDNTTETENSSMKVNTSKPASEESFQGKKFSEKRKKKKFNKDAYLKKKMVKKIAPKSPAS